MTAGQKQSRLKRMGAFMRRNARRIRAIVACVLLGAFLAVPIPFVNTAVGYAPFIAYLLVLLASFVYLKVLVRHLRFETKSFESGCYRKEQLTFHLEVHNESILPAVSITVLFYMSDLFGAPGATTTKHITLPPKATKTFDFDVAFAHIGNYEVGIRQIEVTDPFGIFRHVKASEQLQEVEVQPRIFNVADLQVSSDTLLESKRSFTAVINEGMDYAGVREYRWGDPIKAIHWKLSARETSAEYYTRLYETVTNPGLEIVVDTDAPAAYSSQQLMSVYDGLVEAAFSIEEWGALSGLETLVAFEDDTARTRRFDGPLSHTRAEVLARIPRIHEGAGAQALDILNSEAMSIYSQSNLVLCTSCVGPGLVGTLLRVQANRRNPILVVVVPVHMDAEEQREFLTPLARVGAAGIPYLVISEAEELGKGA